MEIGNRLLIRLFSAASVENIHIHYRHRKFLYGSGEAEQELVVTTRLEDSIPSFIPSTNRFGRVDLFCELLYCALFCNFSETVIDYMDIWLDG